MALSRGIDVSHYQGNVSWPALKAKHGITWGACKATEGTTVTDDWFPRNWAAMKSAGLVRIAYHFARPEKSSAAVQARRFLGVVKPVKGDVLCLDLEKSKLDQAPTNAWAREFGDTLRALYPDCTTVLYAGGYSQNGSGAGLAAHFDYWWYPRYPWDDGKVGSPSWPSAFISSVNSVSGNTTGFARPHIWQWTAELSPGIDANVSTLTAAQLSAGPTPPPPPDGLDPNMNIKDPKNGNPTPIDVALASMWGYAVKSAEDAAAAREEVAALKAEVEALKVGTPISASGSATVTVQLTPTTEA